MQNPPGSPFQPPGAPFPPKGSPAAPVAASPQQPAYGNPPQQPAGAPPAPPGGPGADTGKAKKIAGCGGCGCLLALLFVVAGVVLYFLGTTESAWTEMIPFGYAFSGLSVPTGIIGAAVLIWGIVALQKAKKGQ